MENKKIIYRKSSLFDTQEGIAIAHGCNTLGVMGAGIAKYFKELFPEMYVSYQNKCKNKEFLPGGSFIWKNPTKEGDHANRFVVNLATQDRPGPFARLEWIEESLCDSLKKLDMEVKAIAMPKIGCGLGGLDWIDVKEVLEKVAKTTHVQFIVCVL